MLDGRVKTLPRKSTAGCSRGATCRRTWRRSPQRASRRRPRRRESHPFRQTGRAGGRDTCRRDRKHRHRRPAMVRSAAKELQPRRGCHRPGGLRRRCWGNGGGERRDRRRDAVAARTESFLHTAAYDGAISNYSLRWTPLRAHARFFRSGSTCSSISRSRCDTARTRISTPPSTATPSLPPAAWPHIPSFRGKSFRTTISRTPTPRGSAQRRSRKRACVIVKHANPCGAGRR